MFKKLFVFAAVAFVVTRVMASENKEPCTDAVELYSTVLKEYAKKTDVEDIMKQVQKKNAQATELEISQIIFHVRTMLNMGWSNERILGYAEGVCLSVPATDVDKHETKNAVTFKGI